MSAVQFYCPLCEGLFQIDDALAGYDVSCPHCGEIVTVPQLDAEPPPLPEDDATETQPPPAAVEDSNPQQPSEAVAPAKAPPPASPRVPPKTLFLLPTEQGLVSVHEPVKTVIRFGQECEVKQLTPQERYRRRSIRNAVVFSLCLIVLVALLFAFSNR